MKKFKAGGNKQGVNERTPSSRPHLYTASEILIVNVLLTTNKKHCVPVNRTFLFLMQKRLQTLKRCFFTLPGHRRTDYVKLVTSVYVRVRVRGESLRKKFLQYFYAIHALYRRQKRETKVKGDKKKEEGVELFRYISLQT